jgi:hypothetical protein
VKLKWIEANVNGYWIGGEFRVARYYVMETLADGRGECLESGYRLTYKGKEVGRFPTLDEAKVAAESNV